MAGLVVVVHERLGTWARQLRPRLLDRPVRWVESRSSKDLRAALTGLACPIVVIDLAARPQDGLDALDLVARTAPRALTLVLDPGRHEGIPLLAREIGATHVISGLAPPPQVAAILARWLPLAERRTEGDGWSRTALRENEADPRNWLGPLLAEPAGPPRGPRV